MDKQRRKELVEQYKQMKPDMGIFLIRCQTTNKGLLETSQNLKGKINRARSQLSGGVHPNKELQKEWSELGEDHFSFEILETLKYDKDESKTDYSEELAILRMVWEDKLAGRLTWYDAKGG